MKLKFDPSLSYQLDAIESSTGLFDGMPLSSSEFSITRSIGSMGMIQTELGIANNLSLPDAEILKNLHKIQEKNNIEKSLALDSRDFSIEMETGTGKTYVYLRTIFELNQKYGLKKFIIVVPSIAIREGVLKSIELTTEHFKTLYNNVNFKPFVYDSKRLTDVKAFAKDNALKIMIINIQAFVRDTNIFNNRHEACDDYAPRDLIARTNPVLIIDEPQSVDTAKQSHDAILSLNATAIFRYSATHKKLYNQIYKLDPVQAYDLKLVKHIEVASITADDNVNDAYVKLLEVDNSKSIRARLEIYKQDKSGNASTYKFWAKQGDDLFDKSNQLDAYAQGYQIQNIDCTPGCEIVEFNQGKFAELGQDLGSFKDDIMKAQVFETIEQHFKKERALKGKGIKVLSLFFIDRVANYRVYNADGTRNLGKIALWFEESFQEISSKSQYKDVIPFSIKEVHDGYFSRDKKGTIKDTKGNTADDEDTYSLIMKDKEKLLDLATPLRFIFSHSALKEGWDNPNVFQICTLNETKEADKKRQEIGRGLRLPVNSHTGERVHDEHINRLTVIPNESYESFAKSLQKEFEDDCGIEFGKVKKIAFSNIIVDETPIGQEESEKIWKELEKSGYIDAKGQILDKFDSKKPILEIDAAFEELKPAIIDELQKYIFKNRISNAKDKREIKFQKHVQLGEDFKTLWEKINQQTKYSVNYRTDDLITKASENIKNMLKIVPAKLSITKVDVDINKAGVEVDKILAHREEETGKVKHLPDILSFLQSKTELTRDTLVKILIKSGRINDFTVNPQVFMTNASKEINRALNTLIIEGVKYEKINGLVYEMSQFENNNQDLVRYLGRLYEVQNKDKSLYDFVEFDSEVERKFAADLDNNENVKLFIKLPDWFVIDTPIGSYNPDWAFVTEREEKLYFMRETKSSLDDEDRRTKENQKIKCGKEHFKTIGVDFDVVTDLKEVAI